MKNESGPKAAYADSTPIKSDSSLIAPTDEWDAADALAAMRRRRAAALRLPPLTCGRRDPQFGYARDGAAS